MRDGEKEEIFRPKGAKLPSDLLSLFVIVEFIDDQRNRFTELLEREEDLFIFIIWEHFPIDHIEDDIRFFGGLERFFLHLLKEGRAIVQSTGIDDLHFLILKHNGRSFDIPCGSTHIRGNGIEPMG